jgi:hypothetical protein
LKFWDGSQNRFRTESRPSAQAYQFQIRETVRAFQTREQVDEGQNMDNG